MAGGEIVQSGDRVALGRQIPAKIGADESRGSGDQNPHGFFRRLAICSRVKVAALESSPSLAITFGLGFSRVWAKGEAYIERADCRTSWSHAETPEADFQSRSTLAINFLR